MKLLVRNRKRPDLAGAVLLPNWIWNGIKEEAALKDVSESVIIKRACKNYLVQHNPSIAQMKDGIEETP